MRNYDWNKYDKEHEEMVLKMQRIAGVVLSTIGMIGAALTGEGACYIFQIIGIIMVFAKRSLSYDERN